MPTPKFQTIMVWRKSQQKKLCISWICFNPDFGKIDEFGLWDLERVSENAGKQFTSTEFKGKCQTHGVFKTLAVPEYQEMNGQVEVTWRTLRIVAHFLMVHARVSESYVHFA